MILLFLWVTGFMWYLSDLILEPKKLSCNTVYKIEEKKGKFNAAAYQARKKLKFHLDSDFGYKISCELLEPDNPKGSRRIAVLCHGFTYAKYGCLIYAEIFLKLGFTVIIYDHRNHGLSGKAHTSMGYYERFDLNKVIDWCYKTYGKDSILVTHGESMGAATVLMHLGIDDRVKCAIADCGYSDLRQLLRHQIHAYYHLPNLLVPLESLITYWRAGFWYKQVSPIEVVSRTSTPILFIHGKSDCFVPAYMSKHMYACKPSRKAIYLVAGARHSECCIVNREGYEKRVEEFLRKCSII